MFSEGRAIPQPTLDGCRPWRLAFGAYHCNRPNRTEQPVRDPDLVGFARQPRGHGVDLRTSRKADFQVIEDGGTSVRLILGNVYGQVAPATMFSETF